MAAQANKQSVLTDCWNEIGVWSRAKDRCPKLKEFIHCRNCDVFSNASRRILDHEIPSGYLDEWTEIITHKKTLQDTRPNAMLVFRLGDEWVGLPVHTVKEITNMGTIHKLPHKGSRLIRGMVNVRGELRICVSIGALLQLDRAERYADDKRKGIYERLVCVERDDSEFVFPVSEIHGLERYDPDNLEKAPATISKAKASYTKGILRLQDELVSCLDDELLFYSLEKALV